MHGVAAFTRLVYRRKFTSEDAGRRTLTRPKGPSAPPKLRFPVTLSHKHRFPMYEVKAGGPAIVVYLHGGAYTSEIVGQHWSLIEFLASRTGCDVHVPIYGLAPEYDGLAALEFVTEVIAAADRPVYLVGDSAGGGLALLAAQALLADAGAAALPGDAGAAAPLSEAGAAPSGEAGAASAISDVGPAGDALLDGAGAARAVAGVVGMTLLAPWLDLSMDNPGIEAIEPHDPWLARPGLRPIADAWANGLPLKDPRVSPIYGDLTGLPPTQILVGTRDITLADCRTLRDRLPSTTELTFHEEPGALHVYPLLPVPEARAGRQMIANHIRSALPQPA
ncbi:hypothetical protein L3i22_063140 [Actinoplanes sp. L3-i22]|nr:hypothetical protein L3i22_063140 [Actinoplanes sp. L3-i22]